MYIISKPNSDRRRVEGILWLAKERSSRQKQQVLTDLLLIGGINHEESTKGIYEEEKSRRVEWEREVLHDVNARSHIIFTKQQLWTQDNMVGVSHSVEYPMELASFLLHVHSYMEMAENINSSGFSKHRDPLIPEEEAVIQNVFEGLHAREEITLISD
ncbi:hypothetical protein Trydic_g907 [Trypoxylus dichotomus]